MPEPKAIASDRSLLSIANGAKVELSLVTSDISLDRS